MSKPAGFNYGWVVVGAGALMTCVGFGAMMSLAVFLKPMSDATGWSLAGVSAASTSGNTPTTSIIATVAPTI